MQTEIEWISINNWATEEESVLVSLVTSDKLIQTDPTTLSDLCTCDVTEKLNREAHKPDALPSGSVRNTALLLERCTDSGEFSASLVKVRHLRTLVVFRLTSAFQITQQTQTFFMNSSEFPPESFTSCSWRHRPQVFAYSTLYILFTYQLLLYLRCE